MQIGMTGFTTSELQLELTLSSHELLYVFFPSPGFRLGHIHAIKVVVAHKVVFRITCHIDSLIRKEGGKNIVLFNLFKLRNEL